MTYSPSLFVLRDLISRTGMFPKVLAKAFVKILNSAVLKSDTSEITVSFMDLHTIYKVYISQSTRSSVETKHLSHFPDIRIYYEIK